MRPVPDFDGFYAVDDVGRVFSLERTITRAGRAMNIQARELRPKVLSNGYLAVHLRKPTVSRMCVVHRLVAMAYLEADESRKYVNHIDGDKKNNVLSNLEWVTRSENARHAYAVLGRGLSRPGMRGGNHVKAKAVIAMDEQGAVAHRFAALMDAQRLGFTANGISSSIYGRQKTHRGYRWAFSTTEGSDQ